MVSVKFVIQFVAQWQYVWHLRILAILLHKVVYTLEFWGYSNLEGGGRDYAYHIKEGCNRLQPSLLIPPLLRFSHLPMVLMWCSIRDSIQQCKIMVSVTNFLIKCDYAKLKAQGYAVLCQCKEGRGTLTISKFPLHNSSLCPPLQISNLQSKQLHTSCLA